MKNRRLVLLITMLTCTLAGLAWADTVLYSAPVVKQAGEGVTRVALNVGTKTRFLKADVIEVFSNTALDSEQDDADPGAIVSASGDGMDGTYCRLTIGGGKKEIRGSAMVRDLITGATLSVIPAQ